ncbi:MAG: hypothetical protein M0002_16260 [Rhodospirillales bacterium]|nr:hypothetical protein [Rhodospirillales bacterium]MDA8051528.1 hypothetical protein [Rhodospirillales bacterium]
MFVVTVLYPNESGSKFDHVYYAQKHIPLVRERWAPMGLKEVRVCAPSALRAAARRPIR